jgi:hypothetical protein
MNRDYAQSRIRDALAQAKGNATKARALVTAWAVEDHRLLLGLSQPHLTGIVAHAVNRVIYRQEQGEDEEPIPMTPQGLNLTPGSFGKQILDALSDGETPVFGLEAGSRTVQGRKKASQSHIDAIRQMASKSKPISPAHIHRSRPGSDTDPA